MAWPRFSRRNYARPVSERAPKYGITATAPTVEPWPIPSDGYAEFSIDELQHTHRYMRSPQVGDTITMLGVEGPQAVGRVTEVAVDGQGNQSVNVEYTPQHTLEHIHISSGLSMSISEDTSQLREHLEHSMSMLPALTSDLSFLLPSQFQSNAGPGQMITSFTHRGQAVEVYGHENGLELRIGGTRHLVAM